ncbi:MAG: hypothetical protein C0434_06205, partial [Xanthomonadaceae bacterium]|nr:hypothetical protein [Xanthomonadaceae bacterium]
MDHPQLQIVAAVLFGLAVLHTFAAKSIDTLGHRLPRHAGLFHLLGEVEVVFGVWAMILMLAMAFLVGGDAAVEYAESRHYTEPLFVFVVMVVAASKPILETVRAAIAVLARALPIRTTLVQVWLCLAAVPLFGSLITEPA